MNRLLLTLQYPIWGWWAVHFIYFYSEEKDGMGNNKTVCILDTRTDEIVEDYRIENESNISNA